MVKRSNKDQDKSFLFVLVLVLLTSSIVFQDCDVLGEEDATGPPSGVNLDYHITRSNIALGTWSINLKQNLFAYYRNTNSQYVYNPQNWMIATNTECMGNGVPDEFRGDNCPFGAGVIGFCYVRYQDTIVDTSVIIFKDFQEEPLIDDGNKQSVYTHEVGHCLGLRHSTEWNTAGDTRYVMYPSTDGSDTPHWEELDVIKRVYSTNPSSSPLYLPIIGGRAARTYFLLNQSNRPIYQPNKPDFYIYPYDVDPLGLLRSKSASKNTVWDMFTNSSMKVPPGKLLDRPPSTATFLYYENGDIKEERRNGKGEIVFSKYTKAHHHKHRESK